MTATLEQYRTRFSEHADYSDDTVNLCLSDAIADVCSPVFGDQLDRAQLLYAAHLVELSGVGGDYQAPITSQTIGRVSVSFQGSSCSDAELASTRYGQQYKRLRDSRFIGLQSY